MNRIGLITSGGDAPGMNAAIRAVVRTASHYGLNVVGGNRGYQGLIENDMRDLDRHSVSNIIQRGGTILKTARSEAFMQPEGRTQVAENLRLRGVEGLVVIGGDGSFRGATLLSEEHGIPVVGIPATIDNDLAGTDITIGYDSALNTALDAIDKIRDTADAHDRLFLVEVMGRDAGFIALDTGLASGAEMILLPESTMDVRDVKASLGDILKQQRRSSLVVIAEGDETGGALTLASELREQSEMSKYEMRVCILGHIQRGGNPTARDRVLASRLGYAAVKTMMDGHDRVMVGEVNNGVKLTPLRMTWSKKKDIDFELAELAKVLR